MTNEHFVYFTWKGFQYRTDGTDLVEAKDGKVWNKTNSIPVILAARAAYKDATHA